MKKKLNTLVLQNELEAGSAFFSKSPRRPPQEEPQVSPAPQKKAVETRKRPTERKSVRKTERSENRTEKRSVPFPFKRSTKRFSFEFYIDQIATLRKLEGQAMMGGKSFNKSDFVRRALDDYFAKLGIGLAEPKE